MKKIILAVTFILFAFPAYAQNLDAEIFDELIGKQWVTRDGEGVVNYVSFASVNADANVGIAVRRFTQFSEFGDRVTREIPMMFWVENGILVISGNNFFAVGREGWLWRIDRDTQTIEPIEDETE